MSHPLQALVCGGADEGPLAGFQLNLLPNDPMYDVSLRAGVPYRGIRDEAVAATRALFASGVVDELVSAGLLIPSTLIEGGIAGYSLAIRQDTLGAPTLPSELPPSMRRDAGLVLLRLARVLDRHGFMIRDADLSGIAIDRFGKPKFYNIGAIVPKGVRKFPYAEFHAHFLGPLRLIHERPEMIDVVHRAQTIGIDADLAIRHPLLRSIVRRASRMGAFGGRVNAAYKRFLLQSPFGGLLHQGRYFTFLREVLRERRARANAGAGTAGWIDLLLSDLERKLERLRFDGVTQRWTSYYDHLDLDAVAAAGADWQRYYQGPREQALLRALGQIPKGTLLDIGANNGYYSMLGAHFGFATTAVDNDIGAVNGLYRILQRAGNPLPVRPLVADFVTLEPRHWPRFEADAVFALGFLHHMRRVELLSWSVIAERLAGLTRKILVTEFKPGTGASHAKREITESAAGDYTLEELVAALRQRFTSVEVMGDHSAVNFTSVRTMIVCRK